MNKFRLLSLIIGMNILFGCDQQIQIEAIDELNVEAFLYANEAFEGLKVTKLVSLDSVEADPAPTDLAPEIVTGQGERFSLIYDPTTERYENADLMIEEDMTYRLEIPYNGEVISAETFIPSAIQNLTLSQTTYIMVEINDFSDLQNITPADPLEIEWEAEDGAYFFVAFANASSDPDPINTFLPADLPPRFQRQSAPSTDPYYTIDVMREAQYFDTYWVDIYRVNPEYVALYEDNSSGTGTLNEIRTNVENGFGIFTGINRVRTSFLVKR